MRPPFAPPVHRSRSGRCKSRAISQTPSMSLGKANGNGWVLACPGEGLRNESRTRGSPSAVANHGRAQQGICNAGLSCVFSPAQGAPPRGANSSSTGVHTQNRQLGARLHRLRGIVPLNYPLTPLTLWGAVGPHKSQLLLLRLLFFFK